MYRTLNLILKNKKGVNFLSKLANGGSRFIPTSFNVTKTSSLGNISSKGFSEQDQKFSRISGREPTGQSQKIGKLNIRRVCLKEPTVPFLRFIEENASNMNDYDYIDAIYLLAQKIEESTFRKANLFAIEKYKGFQILKNWTDTNFEAIIKDNFAKFSFLYLLSALNQKNRQKVFFTKEQENIILDANLQTLESGKLSLLSLLNTVTLMTNFRQLNLDTYFKGREVDIQKLQWRAVYKVLKRLTNPRMSRFTKMFLVKFLSFEYFNMTATQPMDAKARAFNLFANLEWEVPFLNIHSKLTNLLKDIKNNAENHDQTSILQVCEGLVYYQDSLTYTTVRDLCDIVSMTIKHQPDNLKPEFVLKFIELLSQFKQQNVVSHETITIFFDYLNEKLPEKQVDSYDLNRLMAAFTMMKKNKYFEKEQIGKLFDIIFPKLELLNTVSADMKNFRFIVGKVMGSEHQERLAKEIVNLALANVKSKPDFNVYQGLRILSRVSMFSQSAEVDEISDLVLAKLEEVAKTVESAAEFIDQYVNKLQEFLSQTERKKILDKLLKFSPEEYLKIRSKYKLFFNLNEVYLQKDKEDLKNKIMEVTKLISSQPDFKKGIVMNFSRLVNDGNTVSNTTVFRVSNLLRQYIKDEEFIKENSNVVERLVMIAFNLLYNAKDEYSLSNEAVSSVLSVADRFAEANPTMRFEISSAKIPTLIKTFNASNLNSSVINQLSMQYMEKFRFNPENFNNNYTVVFEKVIKSDLPKEPISNIIKRDFKTEDDFFDIFSKLKGQPQIQLFNISTLANKKGYEVFTDNLINRLKNFMNETVLNNKALPENLRFYYLFTLPFVKQSVLDFQNEKKNYIQSIKELYENANLKKLVRFYDNLPANNRNLFINRLYFELANAYEKEEKIEKIVLLRVLDKLTSIKYISNSFYNKVISDLESLFNNFNTQDYYELILRFSRIELKKDDVIKACAKQIQLKFLNDQERVLLFNALVKMSYTSSEWKEMILVKLLQDIDWNLVFNKLQFKDKVWFVINLWKLQDWPENREELINQCVASMKMKLKDTDKNYVQFLIRNEEWLPLLYRSPLFEKFDQEFKSQIASIFNVKRERESKRINMQYIIELLKVMGHNEIEVFPADKLCDIYLPKEKVGIILLNRILLNFANTEEVNCTGEFMKEVLNKEGINPAVVSFNKIKGNANNYKESVKYLNSLNVPSLIQEDKYDFTSVESLWNKLSSERPVYEKPAVAAAAVAAAPESVNASEEEHAPKI